MSLAATAGTVVSAGLGGRAWRGHRARPGSERPAHATGSDRRRRGTGRRGARHASSDEHGARRVTVYRTSQLRNQDTFPLALVRSPARWGPTKTSSAQAGDRSQVPLGSKLGDGFASRRGGVLSQIAHVENVSEHEQRVGVVGHVVGGLHELERAPRGGLRLDRGPTEQVRPREQQLASDEGTPIGERDGRLERIGEPEELRAADPAL